MSHIEKNKLNKNFNSWAITSLINNSQVNETPVLAWKIVAGEKITAEVQFLILRKSKNEVVIRGRNPNAKTVLGDLSVGAQNINFYLPKDSALFQTEVKQILSNGDVLVKIPNMIAQVERRNHMRLFLDAGLSVDVEFRKEGHAHGQSKRIFKKPCFDISAGGMSFIATRSELSYFQKNDKIEAIKIALPKEEIVVSGIVTDLLEITPNEQNQLNYKGHKICLQFNNLKKRQLNLLESFVFDHLELDEVI